MDQSSGSDVSASEDMLRDIFTRQESLALVYRAGRPDGFYALPPAERCTEWTRAIVHECCELDDELGWKPWKNPPDRNGNRERRLDEMADILHFFVQLALDQGFSAEDVYRAYLQKNIENRRRQLEDYRYRPSHPTADSDG